MLQRRNSFNSRAPITAILRTARIKDGKNGDVQENDTNSYHGSEHEIQWEFLVRKKARRGRLVPERALIMYEPKFCISFPSTSFKQLTSNEK